MAAIVDDFFGDSVARFTRALASLSAGIPAEAPPRNEEILAELTDRIEDSLSDCAQMEKEIGDEADLLKAVQQRYRKCIWPWFGESWLMQRALEKPRGYPGDYDILTAIYDGQPKSSGPGGYLDRYFLNTILAKAVVARLHAVRTFLLEELAGRSGDVHVLNIASGPCREYTLDFHPTNSRLVDVTCLDNDRSALDFGHRYVAPCLPGHVKLSFVHYNALRLISPEANVRKFGRPDILYSVGLCDYIPDKILVPMLRAWRQTVSEDGVVYVAFKDARLYDKTVYQWLVDWYFLQRTEEDCRRLFVEAGYDPLALSQTRDATGVIINFVSRVSAAVPVRVDDSESLPGVPRHADSEIASGAEALAPR